MKRNKFFQQIPVRKVKEELNSFKWYTWQINQPSNWKPQDIKFRKENNQTYNTFLSYGMEGV